MHSTSGRKNDLIRIRDKEDKVTAWDNDPGTFVLNNAYLVFMGAVAYALGHYLGPAALGGFLGASKFCASTFREIHNQFVANALDDSYLTSHKRLQSLDLRPDPNEELPERYRSYQHLQQKIS